VASDIVEFRIADIDVTRLFLFELEQSIVRLDKESHPEAQRLYRALERWRSNLIGDELEDRGA
jgi:hypothetical protein